MLSVNYRYNIDMPTDIIIIKTAIDRYVTFAV